MAEKIQPHTHCQVCGKAIPVNETLCSEKCRQKYHKIVKKRKLSVAIMFLIVAIFLGIIGILYAIRLL